MKKVTLLTAALLISLAAQANAGTTTYLVDFFDAQGDAYNGNAFTDFGVSGTVLDIGASVALNADVNPQTTSPNVFYTLGSATLTLNNTYSAYQTNPGTSSTDPFHLTGGFLYAKTASPTSLTLTGLDAGVTLNIQLIGSVQGGGPASVTDGTTTFNATIAGANGGTGQGTFTDVGTFTNNPGTGTAYTFNLTSLAGESNYSAALITVTTAVVPEPSTYVMLGMGCAVLFFGLRRRSAQV